MYELRTRHSVCTYMCVCVYKHSSDFEKSFSLYTGSQPWNRVRWNGPRGRTFRGQIHFLLPGYVFYVYTYTQPPRTIIKKIEGDVASLYVRLTAVPRLQIRARYWIPSFFRKSRVVPRVSSFLFLFFPLCLSLSFSFFVGPLRDFRISFLALSSLYHPLLLFLSAQWNMDICVAICTDGWRARVAGSFRSPQKWNTFTTMALSFSFCRVESAKWILRYRKCPGAGFLAKRPRSVTHASKCLLSTFWECSGKVFRCTENIFRSDTVTFSTQKGEKKTCRCAKVHEVGTRKLSVHVTLDLEFLVSRELPFSRQISKTYSVKIYKVCLPFFVDDKVCNVKKFFEYFLRLAIMQEKKIKKQRLN